MFAPFDIDEELRADVGSLVSEQREMDESLRSAGWHECYGVLLIDACYPSTGPECFNTTRRKRHDRATRSSRGGTR